MNKKNKIIVTIIIFILSLICYLFYSVNNPVPFTNDSSLSKNIKLTDFSLLNPKYIITQDSTNEVKKEIFTISLKRNWLLRWDTDQLRKMEILNKDYEAFKLDLDNKGSTNLNNFIDTNPLIINNPAELEILTTDSYDDKQYKSAFNPPNREHSIHYNIEPFKSLKRGNKYKDFGFNLGGADFGLTPSKFYEGYRLEYVIGSNKIAFIFLGFKEGDPGIDEESSNFPLYDIGIVTQKKERIIVPVNPDNTFNWDAIKDKID